MVNKPFRFGLSIGGAGREEFVESVRRAEDGGFDTIWAPDHMDDRLAVFPMLAMAAEVSSSLRIASMVVANDLRNPVLLARDTATIDILSGGRFELGIGTGWIESHYEAVGIPYEGPGVRVARLEEAISVVKGCWSGAPFDYEGRYYRVKGATCPQPAQQPRPPIFIGGARPRLLRIAGREADIVGISPLRANAIGFERFGEDLATSGSRIRAQTEWIREGAGGRFKSIELSLMPHVVVLTDDADGAAAELASETGTTPGEVLESPHILLGSRDRIADTLVERRERYGVSYIVFGGTDFEAITPVVERLSGT